MPTEAIHHIRTSSLEFKNRKPNTTWVRKRREKTALYSNYGQLHSTPVSPVVLTNTVFVSIATEACCHCITLVRE